MSEESDRRWARAPGLREYRKNARNRHAVASAELRNSSLVRSFMEEQRKLTNTTENVIFVKFGRG